MLNQLKESWNRIHMRNLKRIQDSDDEIEQDDAFKNVQRAMSNHNKIVNYIERKQKESADILDDDSGYISLDEYRKLMGTGMLWEFYPQATGGYERDKYIIPKPRAYE